MQPSQLKAIIEAALLGNSQPLSLPQIAALFGADEAPTHDELARALLELGQDCTGRGVELVEVASGYRYQVRQEIHPWLARLWTERQTRYSRALLETLALIAYRQPITRAEIEQIRGVAVATSIVKTLEEREWVRVVGHRDMPGRPALFGTTKNFLDYFNLTSLDQLPPLGEIRDLDDVDLQLAFDPPAAGAQAALAVDPETSGEALLAHARADRSAPISPDSPSAESAGTEAPADDALPFGFTEPTA
ncbi:MAG TPA: SMC-Scp complex subunit ScpB [Rhodanobacteraceae bacterium]|nr:SMC-Scp complex subunit ScpB [Rhodanobacteraceae bacterium]